MYYFIEQGKRKKRKDRDKKLERILLCVRECRSKKIVKAKAQESQSKEETQTSEEHRRERALHRSYNFF